MAQFTVTFVTEAASLEEAEAAVSEWVVTPNTALVSLMGSVSSEMVPLDMPDGGAVADGLKVSTDPTPPSESD